MILYLKTKHFCNQSYKLGTEEVIILMSLIYKYIDGLTKFYTYN